MSSVLLVFFFFFFNDTATTEIYTLSLHDALPISGVAGDFHLLSRHLWHGPQPVRVRCDQSAALRRAAAVPAPAVRPLLLDRAHQLREVRAGRAGHPALRHPAGGAGEPTLARRGRVSRRVLYPGDHLLARRRHHVDLDVRSAGGCELGPARVGPRRAAHLLAESPYDHAVRPDVRDPLEGARLVHGDLSVRSPGDPGRVRGSGDDRWRVAPPGVLACHPPAAAALRPACLAALHDGGGEGV